MAADEPDADQECTYTGVHVQNKERILISGVVDEYAEEKSDHGMLFTQVRGQWYSKLIDDSVAGLCAVVEERNVTLVVGVDGTVYACSSTGVVNENVDPSGKGPSYSLILRGVRIIGDHVYAVGMARMAYRRRKPGAWERIDQGVFVARAQRNKAVGFNDIHGTSETAIYAAGYKGEIWFYNGEKWEQQESPTNVALNGVQCVGEDVFICGSGGTLLRGKQGQWQIIEQDITEEDFWDITFFREHIYLSNYDGVFVLVKGVLEKVDMKVKQEISTAYIDAADGVLWSAGQKDLAYTTDGRRWSISDKP